ncbi:MULTISPECIES: carbohydrate ABC transporter permease [Petrotoga]|uniref:Carbohydrate ABC transporter membrane protein 2 (CUT1 family) n=1 Tax=Petrotoga sibirica TaxID=156202 RepID=A0A4R8ERV8_9BACT|nr:MULTISPECIES: carbohydrate ABC transporter permease [Petrotoga]TDX13278.1 carbohydrate ABC transporter membrane protein 2 (CUT1 family) [Petrotoga sibirica]
MQRKKSKKIINIIVFCILILGAIIMTFPFYYMFITSLKETSYIFTVPPQLIPKPATFQNYITVWKETDFARYFVNSVTITLPAIILNVLLSTLTAYGFARYNFPGKETFFSLLIATLAVPGLLLIIPQFDIVSKIRWLMDNKITLILTGGIGGIAFNAFFLRGFFEAMPVEYEESAELDGANAWQRFIYIVFPQALPPVGALTIMSFLGIWDDYFWPSLILTSKNNWTLPIGIMTFKGQFSVQWNVLFAGTMISLAPVLVVYVLFQKYFIQSVSEGGLKL